MTPTCQRTPFESSTVYFVFLQKSSAMPLRIVSSALCCVRLDISISKDMEAVRKRYVHLLPWSQQASKDPGSRLRHATGGGYAVKWHHCHLSVPSASLSPAHPRPPPLPLVVIKAATMACHLVMNPWGASHWFKVPLLSECSVSAEMMAVVRWLAGSEYRWCFFTQSMLLGNFLSAVAAGLWNWKCVATDFSLQQCFSSSPLTPPGQ